MQFFFFFLKKNTEKTITEREYYMYGPYKVINTTQRMTYANWSAYLDGDRVVGSYATRKAVTEQIQYVEMEKYTNDPDRSKRIIHEMMND